jgi:hypothetical protein
MIKNQSINLLESNIKIDKALLFLTSGFIFLHLTIIFFSVNLKSLKMIWIVYVFISYFGHLLKENNLVKLKKISKAQI